MVFIHDLRAEFRIPIVLAASELVMAFRSLLLQLLELSASTAASLQSSGGQSSAGLPLRLAHLPPEGAHQGHGATLRLDGHA